MQYKIYKIVMLILNRYVNQEDHVWYDSSNLIYSKCYDTNIGQFKTLKLVFKGGRTYVYKNVDANDYLKFKTSLSNGKSFNELIKKYNGEKIEDTNLEDIEKLKEYFIKDNEEFNKKTLSELKYNLKVDEKTGEFIILLDNKPLFRGEEGNFSITSLLKSLNINFFIENVEKLEINTDEFSNKIEFNNSFNE